MKKNRCICCLLILAVVMALSGCSMVTELTDEESSLIAEYAAGITLQYCPEYDNLKLVVEPTATPIPSTQPTSPTVAPVTPATATPDASATTEPVVTPTPPVATPESSPQASQEPTPTQEPQAEVSMNDLYNRTGFSFTYKTYSFLKEYPRKSDIYQIVASKGNVLTVVDVKVANTTSTKKKIALSNEQIKYTMIADGISYVPSLAMFENGGLYFLNTTIAAKSSEEAMLVFEVPSKIKEAKSIKVLIEKGNNVVTINIR